MSSRCGGGRETWELGYSTGGIGREMVGLGLVGCQSVLYE